MFYLFLAEGFEVTEALAALDVMRRAKLSVQTVGVTGEYVTSSHGVIVKSDIPVSDVSLDDAEGVILENGKITAAICAAPSILGHLGILCGRQATCFPGFENELMGANYTASHVETDEHVITAKGAGCAIEFGHAIVSLALDKAAADSVIEAMQCL